MGKILVIVLGVIIVLLLAILFFYNPAKAPATPAAGLSSVPAPTTTNE